MRYVSKGEVHKDFHGLTCATLHYLVDNYGENAVREVLANTAKKVYKTIHEGLKNGDFGELAEFWEYYMKREGGGFSVERLADGVRMVVRDCPALRHLVRLEQGPDEILCQATCIFNEALCDDSPFRATLVRTGEFSCVQEVRR
jgi:predicted ArsR family transcriptional regulator